MVTRPEGTEVYRLIDAAGEFVAWAYLPELKRPPDIITWGSRSFIDSGKEVPYKNAEKATPEKVPVYREARNIQVPALSSNDLQPWNG